MTNQFLIGNALRRADAIITPSQASAEDIRLHFPKAAARLTPIAEAAGERFTAVRNPEAETAWQRYLGITPPYLLYLGQWKAYKNLPLLIEAFAQVVTRQPGIRLVIAGNDPRHSEVRALSTRLPSGSVVLPGHLPDDAIPDVYRGAAALVLPSRAEGFGLPVLEAMACGVPVVCSDIPVMREIADGVAIFCEAESPDALAAGMIAVLQGANDVRIRAGLARAGQFSWQKAAQATVAIYERVLAGRPRTRAETD
jgi:alpha-1,3-rhamnosyl/mannosyltransferase